MGRPLILYHANCNDGFCAAWVAHRKLGDADYLPVQYGQEPPNVTGRDVYILDFSYKRLKMLEIIRDCKRLVVLDHHKTAQEELSFLQAHNPDSAEARISKTACVFDMGKSGARLTLEHFFPGESSWLVDLTEDRDLWRWKLEHSKELNAWLSSLPRTFEVWDEIENPGWKETQDRVECGAAILRYQAQLVESICGAAREVDLDGHKILAVNTSCLFSEVAERLASGRPFGAAWFVRSDGKTQWSLRSRDGGIDVSEVAKRHGGGGHRAAAGFEAT